MLVKFFNNNTITPVYSSFPQIQHPPNITPHPGGHFERPNITPPPVFHMKTRKIHGRRRPPPKYNTPPGGPFPAPKYNTRGYIFWGLHLGGLGHILFPWLLVWLQFSYFLYQGVQHWFKDVKQRYAYVSIPCWQKIPTSKEGYHNVWRANSDPVPPKIQKIYYAVIFIFWYQIFFFSG